jgi:hypothetical protein
MSNAFTDLMIARKLEKIRAELAEVAGQPGPEGPAGPAGADGAQGPAGPAFHMDVLSGSYYVLNPGTASNATQFATGAVYLAPVYLPAGFHATEIWVQVASGAVGGSTAELGWYLQSGSTFTKQATFGTVDSGSTGPKTLAGDWTFPAGIVWMAWLVLGGQPVFRGTAATPMIPGPILSTTSSAGPFFEPRVMLGPNIAATLPASFTSSVFDSTFTPFRFAAKAA